MRRLDDEMSLGGYCAFVVHSQRDVLLAGLTPDLAHQAFHKVANERDASFVVKDAAAVVPLIQAAAENGARSHATYDNFTARFGYSCGPASPLPKQPAPETLARAIARGGTASVLFQNHQQGSSLGSSRAQERMAHVDAAAKVSQYFRETWIPKGHPPRPFSRDTYPSSHPTHPPIYPILTPTHSPNLPILPTNPFSHLPIPPSQLIPSHPTSHPSTHPSHCMVAGDGNGKRTEPSRA